MIRRYRGIIGLGIAVLLAAVAATITAHPSTPSAPQPTAITATNTQHLLDQIADHTYQKVDVYNRVVDFGPAWQDVDGNGCNTRDDILARDLVDIVTKNGCTVLSGILHDPYTGQTIDFRRGVDTSTLVQIDHVVPLAYAWAHGAATWTAEQRLAYANDPRLLLAVDGPANQAKGAAGPAGWMPPAPGYACTYVSRFVTILHTYDLTIDAADRAAITRTLTTC